MPSSSTVVVQPKYGPVKASNNRSETNSKGAS